MKNRRFKIISLCAALAAGLFAVLYASREPSVDGRTLAVVMEFARDQRWQNSPEVLLALSNFQTSSPAAVSLITPYLTNIDVVMSRQTASNTLTRWNHAAAGTLFIDMNFSRVPASRN